MTGSRSLLRTRSRHAATGAIRLRAWCHGRLLAGHEGPPPPADALAWRLFLQQERCAALLQASLTARPLAAPLPEHACALVASAAALELRHILAVRLQLRTVAAIAADTGWRIVVLKGAADVASGVDVPTADVDVWAEADVAPLLARRLDEAGYRPRSTDGHYHLAPRTMPGALNIEVHRAVTGFEDPGSLPLDRAHPIESLPPLLRLSPEDHAWTILGQALRKHPDRRGRLRDLVLLRGALDGCTPEGRERLEARLREEPEARAARQMIDAALGDGAAGVSDRLYLFLARERRLGDRPPISPLLRRMAREIAAQGAAAEWRRRTRQQRVAPWRHPAIPAVLHVVAWAAAALLTLDLPLLRREGAAEGSLPRPPAAR